MARANVPVALFIYNRPAHLPETFARVRELRPATLFVVGDGPKSERDAHACESARSYVTDHVDWPCQVTTLFRAENIGTARSVSDGLTWIFGQVDRAIILEDDCVADPSFFFFCEEMLARYVDDERVMQVSGTNVAGRIPTESSYGFTRYGLPCWGWATWARAWARYDFTLATWDEDREAVLDELGPRSPFWVGMVDRYRHKLHGWDVQWNAAIWKHGGRIIVPSVNLVGNTGYGEAATYTRVAVSRYSNLARGECVLPPVHPVGIDPVAQAEFDTFVEPKARDLIEELGNFYRSTGIQPGRDKVEAIAAATGPTGARPRGLASLRRFMDALH